MLKIGRRGSMSAKITAYGKQGHTAYPDLAKNPLPGLVRLLDRFASKTLDKGTAHFGPSTLAITTIDVGNRASNVIPAEATATINIRFNDAHTSQSLSEWIDDETDKAAGEFGIGLSARIQVSGESCDQARGLREAGRRGGGGRDRAQARPLDHRGTSDARFVTNHCPVVEFGLVGKTIHQVNENVPIEEIETLKRVYARILHTYFAETPRD